MTVVLPCQSLAACTGALSGQACVEQAAWAVQAVCHLLLLQQMKLTALHAKVAVLIKQGLSARVCVVAGHDDHLKLHRLPLTS